MKQKHYIIYDLLLKYKIMTIPFKNAFVLYSLNNYKTIAKSSEAMKFNEIMDKYKDKSGDMFIKNMLIKCCELVIESKLKLIIPGGALPPATLPPRCQRSAAAPGRARTASPDERARACLRRPARPSAQAARAREPDRCKCTCNFSYEQRALS